VLLVIFSNGIAEDAALAITDICPTDAVRPICLGPSGSALLTQHVSNKTETMDNRNYHLFAFLADVRNYWNVKGFKPKGLPFDLSQKKHGFESYWEQIQKNYSDGSKKMFVKDGQIIEISEVENIWREVSKEEYEEIEKFQKENIEEASKRYGTLQRQYGENPKYSAEDAVAAGGEFKKIPYKEIYSSVEGFAKKEYEDDWDEDAHNYGRWRVDFNYYDENGYGDYHTPSYLTLQELVDADTTDYTANMYKIDREFYDVFTKNGGVLPEIFTVKGETEPTDIAECFREALNPTIIISWQKNEEEKAGMALFKGIEELKEIAKKYDIEDYNNIRIVFAFDN
jgi:hypothetical protein